MAKRVLSNLLHNQKILLGSFLFVLAVFVLLAVATERRSEARIATEASIEQSYQKINELETVSQCLEEAQASELHFFLDSQHGSQDHSLEIVHKAADNITAHMDRLAALSQSSVEFPERLTRIHQSLRSDLDQIRFAMQPGQKPGATPSQAGTLESIQQLKVEEQDALATRKILLQEQVHQLALINDGTMAARFLVMAILFFGLFRGIQAQQRSQEMAAGTRTQLESYLTQLQTETENVRMSNELQQNFQICVSASEAYEIVTNYLKRLFPEANGSLATINNSRNIMETVLSWGSDENIKGMSFAPEDCCAMRGGRLYTYTIGLNGLPCRHFANGAPDAYMCLPMVALGETLGILHLNSPDASVLSSPRMWLLQRIVEQAAMTLANLNLRVKLQEQSIRDPLTSLFNRRYLEIALEREVRRSARKKAGLAVIMVDGDRFKHFNDTFGHDAGDIVLKEIAAVLRRSIRGEDIACRYGGEEFTVVMSDCNCAVACERAELMRKAISDLQLSRNGQALGKVTASFGVSHCSDGSISAEVLLRLADQALYRAKKEGRDRVVLNEFAPPALTAAIPKAEAAEASTVIV